MKLYICWGTWKPAPRPGGHPCGTAYHALKDAGHDPEVVKVQGLAVGPRAVADLVPGDRSEVEKVSGQRVVPVLVTDDGEVITESRRIAEWAQSHPAGRPSSA